SSVVTVRMQLNAPDALIIGAPTSTVNNRYQGESLLFSISLCAKSRAIAQGRSLLAGAGGFRLKRPPMVEFWICCAAALSLRSALSYSGLAAVPNARRSRALLFTFRRTPRQRRPLQRNHKFW